MDALDAAVVDIARLIASGRVLRSAEPHVVRRKTIRRRRKLSAELRRGAGVYLKTLARAPNGFVNEAVLVKCRLSAERCMPAAVASVQELAALMDRSAGSLDGLAMMRHDLWRLSHIAIHLGEGTAMLGKMQSKSDHLSTRRAAKPLQKEFRRALVAYANTAMKEVGDSRRWLRCARHAAIAELSDRCVDIADQLAWLGDEFTHSPELINSGVATPLRHLLMDWTANESC